MNTFQPGERALVLVRGAWTVVNIILLRHDGYRCELPNGWLETFEAKRLIALGDQANIRVEVRT